MRLSVFTKPWKDHSLSELAAFVRKMGFESVELPVRPGFQVEPEHVARDLPEAARVFADHGIAIDSVAANADETLIAACGQAGVPIIRTLVRTPQEENFIDVLDRTIAAYQSLVPALGDAGVRIGVQNHCRREISSTMGLRYVVAGFDPAHVAGVLDFGHCGLAGEPADEALDQIGDHLAMANLKNAYWYRLQGPEKTPAQWGTYWTTGPHGMADWQHAIHELKKRGYDGAICLCAEYSDQPRVNELITEDLAYVKTLIAEAS